MRTTVYKFASTPVFLAARSAFVSLMPPRMPLRDSNALMA